MKSLRRKLFSSSEILMQLMSYVGLLTRAWRVRSEPGGAGLPLAICWQQGLHYLKPVSIYILILIYLMQTNSFLSITLVTKGEGLWFLSRLNFWWNCWKGCLIPCFCFCRTVIKMVQRKCWCSGVVGDQSGLESDSGWPWMPEVI